MVWCRFSLLKIRASRLYTFQSSSDQVKTGMVSRIFYITISFCTIITIPLSLRILAFISFHTFYGTKQISRLQARRAMGFLNTNQFHWNKDYTKLSWIQISIPKIKTRVSHTPSTNERELRKCARVSFPLKERGKKEGSSTPFFLM